MLRRILLTTRLTASADSEPFLIDNTPPEITGLAGAVSGSKLDLRFHAKDAISTLGKAEYSINGSEWTVVEADHRVSPIRWSTTIACR